MLHKTLGSVTGPSHVAKGEPCQDVAAIHEHGDLTLLVVSDGAGSLKNSHVGAAVAVEAAGESLATVADVSVDSAAYIVESSRAAVLALDEPDVGCTIALLLTDGENWAAAGIGDSFVVVEASGTLEAFSSEPGEFVNITQLLTSRDVDLWSSEGEGFFAAAACSDGLEHHTLKDSQPHEAFWRDVFRRVSRGTHIQSIIEFMDKNEMLDDDTSAAIGVLDTHSTDE